MFNIEVTEDIEPKKLDIDEKEFPGFKVLVKYLPPDVLTKMQAKCQETVRGVRGQADRSQTDTLRWSRMIVEKAVLGWEGLKLEYLEAMLPITAGTREAVKKAGGTVPFDIEAAKVLAVRASDRVFMGPVVRFVTDWAHYNEEAKVEEKNESAA